MCGKERVLGEYCVGNMLCYGIWIKGGKGRECGNCV